MIIMRQRVSFVSLLFILVLLAANNAQSITLTAGELSLTLELTGDGVTLRSLLDTGTGRELLAPPSMQPPLPLFEIDLRRVNEEGQIEWAEIKADSGWSGVSVKLGIVDSAEITWRDPLEISPEKLTVVARVDLDAENSAMRWSLQVESTGHVRPEWSVWEVKFPQVALAALGSDARVFFPRGSGEVKEVSGEFGFWETYPCGYASMQFMATYNTDIGTGLYLATHDPDANMKYIRVGIKPGVEPEPKFESTAVPKAAPADSTAIVLEFRHPAEDMSIPGNGFTLSGQAIWQLLRGDWFDAAMIYKDWVRKEAKWFPELTTEGRSDTPMWVREMCVWARDWTKDIMPEQVVYRMLNEGNGFKPFFNLPVGLHWYKWHEIPFDNDYPHYFPAIDGFDDCIPGLQNAGVFIMPYINGRLWDTRDRGIEDFMFTSVAEPHATKDQDGHYYWEEYNSEEANGDKVRFAVMCPATKLWQDWVRDICAKLFSEYGVNAVYLDQIAAARPKLCFDETHSHPLGGGHWWVDGYGEMLQSIHDDVPEGVLTTECNAEPYMRWFDGYLTWHWQFDGQVPAFPAVYGAAIQMFGREYKDYDSDPEWTTKQLSIQMKAGQQLVFGEQIGWLFPNIYENLILPTRDFIYDVVWLRWYIRRYFYAGEMCRPSKLAPEVPPVTADWRWRNPWPVTTDSVLTGAWKLPQDNKLALIFANVSDNYISTGISFNAEDYGIECGQLDITTITPEGPGETFTRPPVFHEYLCFPPRTVWAWEITPTSYDIDLAEGWDLISLPLQPEDTDPAAVLSSIENLYDSVWAYDPEEGWTLYISGYGGDLNELVSGRGYWIKMDQDGTLIVEGVPPESTAIPLRGGEWNLVGFMSQEPRDVEVCMLNVIDCIDSVWEYDPLLGWRVFDPDGVSDLKLMRPGYGYWIKANQDCVWDINEIELRETETEIIMRNRRMEIIMSKNNGEITTLTVEHEDLLAENGHLIIKDKVSNKEFRQSEGTVAGITTEVEPNQYVSATFDIIFTDDSASYLVRVKYTLDRQALRWDAELDTILDPREIVLDFNIPVLDKLEYAFWTQDDAPFDLSEVPLNMLTYRRGGMVLPVVTLYNQDLGVSMVSPFEVKKPGLSFEWETLRDGHIVDGTKSFTVSNFHLRGGRGKTAKTALWIVPHEGDWRAGLAWLYDKYPQYFDLVSERVPDGEGWYTMGSPFTDEQSMKDAQQRHVKWEEFHGHFPFYGLYAPVDRDEWWLIIDRDDISLERWESTKPPPEGEPKTGYAHNNDQIALWHDCGIQSYIYYQSFESWHQYAEAYFPEEIARDKESHPLPAWTWCNLMNPDPEGLWGQYILSQLNRLLDKYPAVDGIFYDRDDYCGYDYAHDDGETMDVNEPVYMLGFAQERINECVADVVHAQEKGIWTNGPTSVEVCRGMDGIMSENICQAPYLQYLGIARPMILLPYDGNESETEEKLKIALYTGHFPSVTYGGAECRKLDEKYNPLFSLCKGRKWVLYPDALRLPEGMKGNIFQTPQGDYLVAMVDPEKSQLTPDFDPFYYDLDITVKLPVGEYIRNAYLLSGDYQGVNRLDLLSAGSGGAIAVKVPYNMVSSLILLSKEPKYEITRYSAPVLVRGEEGSFAISVQNIKDSAKYYDLYLRAPFGDERFTFSLIPGQIKVVSKDFVVPDQYPTGEEEGFSVISDEQKIQFSSWVVDPVQFQFPRNVFIKFPEGEDIPFALVNNTDRSLSVSLEGEFVAGQGSIFFLTSQIQLTPFEKEDLLVHIAPETDQGMIRITAEAEGKNWSVTCSVERAMIPQTGDLFYDQFESMDNWEIRSGQWQIVDGSARGSGSGHLAIAEGTAGNSWDNYKFQVNTKIAGSSTVNWLKSYVFFRVQADKDSYYRFGIHGDSGVIDLYKRYNGNWEPLERSNFYPQKNSWYNLRVEVYENSIKGFLDGEEVISHVDEDSPFMTGGIGIGVLEDYMTTYYDDVVVREIPPIPSPEPR